MENDHSWALKFICPVSFLLPPFHQSSIQIPVHYINPYYFKLTQQTLKNFNLMNATRLVIPSQLQLDGNKTKFWCFKDPKTQQSSLLEEAYLKIKTGLCYFAQPYKDIESFKEISEYEYTQVIVNQKESIRQAIKKGEKFIDPPQVLLKFQLEGGITQYRSCSVLVADEIKKYDINQKLAAIYQQMSIDTIHFYNVRVFKNPEDSSLSTQINHINANGTQLKLDKKTGEFVPEQHPLLDDNFPKSMQNQMIHKSNSVLINEKLGKIGKDLFRSLSSLSSIPQFLKMAFELGIDNSGSVYWMNTSELFVSDGEDSFCPLSNLKYELGNKQIEVKKIKGKVVCCDGIYCEYKGSFQYQLIDDKDEMNNLYLMATSEKKRFEIEYKSILLDLIEREKTIQRVRDAFSHIDISKDTVLPDNLNFRFRKYYYLSDIKHFKLFKHLHFANLYQKKRVCAFCKAMYSKIDNLRISSNNEKNPFLNNPKMITEEIDKYFNEQGQQRFDNRENGNGKEPKDIRHFNAKFYDQLELFDNPEWAQEFYQLPKSPKQRQQKKDKLTKQVQTKVIKTGNRLSKKIYTVPEGLLDKFDKIRLNKINNLMYPSLNPQQVFHINATSKSQKLNRKHLQGPSGNASGVQAMQSQLGNSTLGISHLDNSGIKANQSEFTQSQQLPMIQKKGIAQSSLRLYLGTNKPIQDYEHGSITTSSSIKLAALQNKMTKLDEVTQKNLAGKLSIPEHEFLDLIMCPYYGKGKRDTSRLDEYLKNKQDHEILKPKTEIQVTIDKLKYMDHNKIQKQFDKELEKKIKSKKDKEDKEKRVLKEQQLLMENYSDLSKSLKKDRSRASKQGSFIGLKIRNRSQNQDFRESKVHF